MASSAGTMYEFRELRRLAGLRQRDLAELLSVPLETLRTWDSGRRLVPPQVLEQAKVAVMEHARNTELLSLDHLARAVHSWTHGVLRHQPRRFGAYLDGVA